MEEVEGFEPIGNWDTRFTGTFDGNEHTISNLSITHPTLNYVGLFGYIVNEEGANTIYDLNLMDVSVSGFIGTGGLAGVNYGTISNCSVTGEVVGNDNGLLERMNR